MRANGEGQEFILISMHSSHFNTEAKVKKNSSDYKKKELFSFYRRKFSF